MNNTALKHHRIPIWIMVIVVLFVLARCAVHALTWTIIIHPSAGGDVSWSTSDPPASGVLRASGKLQFDTNAFVDLTFEAAPGWALEKVLKNSEDLTPYLDLNDHFQFGPVDNPHIIVAVYTPVVPTGSFNFAFPSSNPDLTAIVDLTGNYTGVSPPRHHRPYDIDVAMDEDGKLAAMGTIQGIEPKGGGELMGGIGQIDTVQGQATAKLGGSFVGTRDGLDGTCTATATGPAALQDIGGGQLGIAGTGSYHGKLDGIPFAEKNVPGQFPATAAQQENLRKDWGLNLIIAKRMDPETGKVALVARATLKLPNNNTVEFAEKKVKYSVKRGYNLAFAKGTNVTLNPPAVDKKTTIAIKQMKLEQVGSTFTPVEGTLSYKFLGQKGKADVVDLLL
jgi:hypothetical protein